MIDETFHLTPLDVRRYEFGKALRGYDPERVNQFRDQVAEELERLSRMNQELDAKARGFHEQLRAFRERDKAINDALVSAQQLARRHPRAGGQGGAAHPPRGPRRGRPHRRRTRARRFAAWRTARVARAVAAGVPRRSCASMVERQLVRDHGRRAGTGAPTARTPRSDADARQSDGVAASRDERRERPRQPARARPRRRRLTCSKRRSAAARVVRARFGDAAGRRDHPRYGTRPPRVRDRRRRSIDYARHPRLSAVDGGVARRPASVRHARWQDRRGDAGALSPLRRLFASTGDVSRARAAARSARRR